MNLLKYDTLNILELELSKTKLYTPQQIIKED